MFKAKKSIQIYKFTCFLKETIWGGEKIPLLKGLKSNKKIGESWEISSIDNSLSFVTNGDDIGLSLKELIIKYKYNLVGKKCYDIFGDKFPLLLKFIDAQNDLSIQVHPDGKTAMQLDGKAGKTEMWYIISCEENTNIIAGFKNKIEKSNFIEKVKNNNIIPLLNKYKIKSGDAFYIPSGVIHAIQKGTFLAEIQQSSDLTYRLYDYDRVDINNKKRELHTNKAQNAIDYSNNTPPKIEYTKRKNQANQIVDSEFFTVSILDINQTIIRDYTLIDSFIAYMCVEGECQILDSYSNKESIKVGETVLMSALSSVVKLSPKEKCKLLEIHL